jgi:hypothetical protein
MVAALAFAVAVKTGGALSHAPPLGKATEMGPVLYVIGALAVVALVVLVVILERLHIRSAERGIPFRPFRAFRPFRGSVRAR